MRVFLRFFFSSPLPEAALVFFAAFSVVVFAGALEAVDAGALPAVEAGLGAIASVGCDAGCEGAERAGRDGRGGQEVWMETEKSACGIYTDARPRLPSVSTRSHVTLLIASKQRRVIRWPASRRGTLGRGARI